MNTTNSTSQFSCTPNLTGNFAIVLLFLALPFHFLVGKILAFNLRFENPRHIILFCLSISDSLQLTITAICVVVSKTGDLHTGTPACDGLRYTILFNSTHTYIVSSLSLVALSIERYIACFHSYRIHELLTNKRIIPTLVAFWICGVIFGGIACIPASQGGGQPVVTSSVYFDGIFVSVTFSVSLVLIVVQSVLFHLSRKKLNRVQPGSSFSNDNEAEIQRKRQIKVAIVASAVVASYSICMLPGAIIVIVNQFAKISLPRFWKQMLAISLGMLNTLMNPFIYGLGMVDTREAIIKDLRKIKNLILIKLGLRDELDF